jgi:hypothetical protein
MRDSPWKYGFDGVDKWLGNRSRLSFNVELNSCVTGTGMH